MAIHNNILVKFNVGGKIFQTPTSTLANAGHNSFFGKMFDKNWNLQTYNSADDDGNYFIDRNPDCFAVLLDLLRTGELYIPSNIPVKLLHREALFYGLLDNVRSAKCGQFDGNRLRFSHSVMGQAPGDGTAIRGSPDGGCCVVHDIMVHVYDWMLEEHPPINLDYQRVYDIGWVDSATIVVSAGGGGMGLFSAATGELRHRFQVTNEDHQVKSYAAGALSFNSDYKIFSSCKGENNKEYGIGVWDQLTGKQIEFYYDQYGWSLGEANRLQWLHGTNCLMVATLSPRKQSSSFINLLDFRVKNMIELWSHWPKNEDDEDDYPTTQWQFRDAIAMEETNSICLVNECGDFGFLDLRSIDMSVRWCLNNSTVKFKMKEPCYPKLAFHNGQLFLSMNHSIWVYCGPDWVLTSRLGRSNGGSICDFSVCGDRLFALHYQQNVFDIWEMPQKPIC